MVYKLVIVIYSNLLFIVNNNGCLHGCEIITWNLSIVVTQEAETLISQFLMKCKTLDQSLSNADLEKQMSSLKEDVLSHKNPYIDALLAAS